MIVFGNKEKNKLAAATGLAPIQVDKLMAMGVIDEKGALMAIIKHDAAMLRRKRIYKMADIHKVLAERYGVSVYIVKKCMTGERKERRYHCVSCGKEITWKTKKKNYGKCETCVVDDLRKETNAL